MGRGQSASWGFSPGNFCLTTGKREGRKKGKMGNKRRKIVEGQVENWKRMEKSMKMCRGPLFFIFYLYFNLFIYLFFLLVTFWNNLNLFWVYQNGNFLTEKTFILAGKKLEKMNLPPLKNIPLPPLIGRLQQNNHLIQYIVCREINLWRELVSFPALDVFISGAYSWLE